MTVAETPDGGRRDVVVTPVKSDLPLREKAWVDHNRQTVDRLSDGRIAYIYLSDMRTLGLQQFIRQYYGQLNKQALIIDDRWNFGGGFEQMILERLRRIQNRLDVNRERAPDRGHNQFTRTENRSHQPLFGLRGRRVPIPISSIWIGEAVGDANLGGVRGVRGEWRMMDNGYVEIPEWSLYNTRANGL